MIGLYLAILALAGLASTEAAIRYAWWWPRSRRNGHATVLSPMILGVAVAQAGMAAHSFAVLHYLALSAPAIPRPGALAFLAASTAVVVAGTVLKLAPAWAIEYDPRERKLQTAWRAAAAVAVASWFIAGGSG